MRTLMPFAPASTRRRTVHRSRTSGMRFSGSASYPDFSYARRTPAFGAFALSAGSPYSGSMRMAVAYGVRAFVTAVLNSVSDSGVPAPPCLPISRISDPRWSIAAARMMPRSSAQASMFFALPFVTRARVWIAMMTSPCKLRTRGLENRCGHSRNRRSADPQRESHGDEPQYSGRDEHQVVVAEKVAEEAAREGGDRRAEHVREEDPAVDRPERGAPVDRSDEVRGGGHGRDPVEPIDEGKQ